VKEWRIDNSASGRHESVVLRPGQEYKGRRFELTEQEGNQLITEEQT